MKGMDRKARKLEIGGAREGRQHGEFFLCVCFVLFCFDKCKAGVIETGTRKARGGGGGGGGDWERGQSERVEVEARGRRDQKRGRVCLTSGRARTHTSVLICLFVFYALPVRVKMLLLVSFFILPLPSTFPTAETRHKFMK